jgi:L,D-transpeptidase ErfK/SrfK
MLQRIHLMPRLGSHKAVPSPTVLAARPSEPVFAPMGQRLLLNLCGLLLAALLLPGCTTLSGFELFAEKPVPTDRFVLPDDNAEVIGAVQVVVAHKEDTLPDFARRYGLGHNEIVAANPGVDTWLPGQGTQIVLPTQFVLPDAPRKGVVVNLAALRLFYYPPRKKGEPQVVITHPIGIGREGWRTPVGEMRVTAKIENPTWSPPASIRREHASRGDRLPGVVQAGPDNPLGLYAMRLNQSRYLLHGTNKPYGIGMRVSHGCIQLRPEDISSLFKDVPIGTKVRVVNQPYLAGWGDGQLYLQAHPPLAEDAARWKGSLKPVSRILKTKASSASADVDWERARQAAQESRGIPVPVSPGSPSLDDILSGAKRVPRIPPWQETQEQNTSNT